MNSSPILPPAPSKPAEIAAPPAQESAAAAETGVAEGAPSFGQVLKSQMDKSSQEKPANAEPAPEDAEGLPSEAAVGAEVPGSTLIGLLAAGQDARRQQPVDLASLAARSLGEASPGQQIAEAALRGTAASAGRAVLTASDRGAGVDKAERLGEAATRFQADEPGATRRSGALSRVPRDDFAPLEKGAGALASSEVPTSVVPAAGSGEARRTDPSALRLTVAQPVGATGWDEAVADRVTWLGQARQPSAELHLNPPNLGPVEVHVTMQGDQATVSFFSAHAPVREALQAAAPRLSEAFAAAGLSLGNVSVGADSNSGRDNRGQEQGRNRRSSEEDASISAVTTPAGRWNGAIGGMRAVDLFA
jgi:flagellar hook-length control protein FliK